MSDILERSLKKAFIDQKIEGSLYDPKIIINDIYLNNLVIIRLSLEVLI